MSRSKRGGRRRERPGRAMQPQAAGQPATTATPARCDECGTRTDSDVQRARHQQATGHRHWTLIRGVAAGYATR